MARDFPRESRLFANEMLQGAPHAIDVLEGALKVLVDEKARVIERWMADGRIVRTDAYHLIFSIWATTQHYADFDAQVQAVLGADAAPARRYKGAEETMTSVAAGSRSPCFSTLSRARALSWSRFQPARATPTTGTSKWPRFTIACSAGKIFL